MSSDEKDMEKVPDTEDPLFGVGIRPLEEKTTKILCCTCTRKRIIILIIIAVMLLLYVIGLAIGIAIGLGNKEESPSKEEPHKGPVAVGVVVSDHEACSDIGRDILARYGTAVDAAIATLICCGVRVPQSMGIGGGSYMIIYNKSNNSAVSIDGRTMAPQTLTSDLFTKLSNKSWGPRIGIPGELKAYKYAHNIFGRLPWEDLFQPTIDMVKHGFPVTETTANSIKNIMYVYGLQNLKAMPTLCNVFCSDIETGTPYEAGENMTWPHMAETLQGIADMGPDYLYDNRLTYTLVEEIKEAGGVLELADFIMNYKVQYGDSLSIRVGNYTVHTMPGASGGPVLALILHILKHFKAEWKTKDLSNTLQKADVYHQVLEAMKFGLAHHLNLEDPDFSEQSKQLIEKMTLQEYADRIQSKITEKTHYANYYTDITKDSHEHSGTAHVSVLSPYGDAVSVTSSLNYGFGSKIVSNSTGVIWNNEMSDFSTEGTVNLVEPLKRPRSSMTPVIVTDQEGAVKLVTGAEGGSKILSSVTQVIVKILLLDMPLDEVIEDKRFHVKYQNEEFKVSKEQGFPQGLHDELHKRGHNLEFDLYPTFSIVQSIIVNNGKITGLADPRKTPGKASYVYKPEVTS